MSMSEYIKYYLEYDTINERKSRCDNDNIIVVRAKAQTDPGMVRAWVPCINTPGFVKEEVISEDYISEWCRQTSREEAKLRQPRLVEYVEDMVRYGGVPLSKRNTPTDPFIQEMSRV